MLRPHELAERRAGKLDELRGILAAGDVNDEGRARFDQLKGEVEALDADLARAEFLAQAERRMAAGAGDARQDPLDHELAGYSVVRAIAAQIPDMAQRIDAGREREVSQELQRRSGRRHEGLTVPLQALEKRVLTTAAPVGGPGGNLVPTDHRPDLFIEPLRARLVVRRLGARVLSGLTGNLDIPRLTKSAVGEWVAENAAITASDPEFDKVSLAPKHCGGIVEMSRNMLQQTSPDVEQLVRSDLAAVLARAIDKAAIAGTGGTEPLGGPGGRLEGLPVVMACVGLISETVATLPLKLYRPRPDGGREEAPAHPLARVLAQPNARMSGAELRELLMRSLLLHGNAYCRVAWDGRGALTGLEPLPPGAVNVLRLANGRLAYDITGDRGGRVRLLADEVLHLRHLSRDGVLGRSPLQVAREALDLALAEQTYAASFYANSARPDVILTAKVPISAEQAIEARNRWEELYRGAARAFRPALLPFDMDLKVLQPSHRDQQFIETRRLSNEDICRIYGVPPPAVHILDRATF